MPRAKKPLRYTSEGHIVAEDVKKHFGKRLPPEWVDVVAAAIYPDFVAEPSLVDSVGHENLRKCYAREPDLTLEIMGYARQRCAVYDPWRKHHTQAGLVRASLLRHWHGLLVEEQAGEHKGEWRSLTRAEWKKRLEEKRAGKPHRLKTREVCQLKDHAIIDWLRREHPGWKFTWDNFRTARRSIS